MSKLLLKLFVFVLAICLVSCTKDKKEAPSNPASNTSKIFAPLSAKASGITFSNDLKEDSIINYFTYPYIYMGGGLAIGDVNNDGFPDIYFTGNMVENKLYLNNATKGSPSFKDITKQAKVGGDDRWVTGVTMADVNADGWLDIYVSVSGKFTTKKNLLYLNDGVLKDGIPSFTESAEERGLADEGSSTQGTFFDYDNDGDLDLYVANYPYTSFKTPNYSYQIFIEQKKPEKSDKLYQNNGNGYFEDVTEAAGLLSFGLSLSATVGDFNQDGWNDIYVSNDFATPDLMFLNNQDGTFSNKIKETTQHTAYFGMGADAADFNNDGLLDLLQMDMTPKDNRRNKANMASMNIPAFWEIVNMGMHYQYMQNALQVNNGITADGLPHFSDISRISGMSSTDWSWACLFADLDNDGWKDIFITNGTRRDINNKDYFNAIENANYETRKKFTKLGLSQNIPAEKVDNYAFKNNGDLTFDPVIEDWGLSFEGFSNGAAYADLDNDGDLDLVVNNIDESATVYQNKTSDLNLSNFIRVQFKGSKQNPQGIGTKVTLKNKGGIQYQELALTRGFQSSVEPVLHFGLGQEDAVEEINITWPDGKTQTLLNIPSNQMLTIDYQDAGNDTMAQASDAQKETIFSDITADLGIDFRHTENDFDDFKNEILLPHAYSRNGPGLAVADVNGDGLEDFYIGGAIGRSGSFYYQNADGTFKNYTDPSLKNDSSAEDMGATFFDADNDGDQDLYVVSGGNERKEGSPTFQDRLYLNNGQGVFKKSSDVLPQIHLSGSRVKAADYDQDGDLDLFVGGRTVPQSYPLPAKSSILKNEFSETGTLKFTDVTAEFAPDLLKAGLVTDAVWVDFNQDKKLDLVVVGEWMPLTFLQNTGEELVDKTETFGMERTTGWWYSIIADDFDKDGDMDFVAGNLGLNYKYKAEPEASFDVYANDFDKNGKLDIVLGYYNEGIQYPVRGKQCSSEQIPTIKYKYKDYNSFADASIEDVYTKQDLQNSIHYQAWTFASCYIQNNGNQDFEIKQLPNAAQLSSINGIVTEDINQDGNLDIIAAGNLFSSEIETPRNDASYGLVLTGDGGGNFQAIPFSETGFYSRQDTKDLAKIKTKQGVVILFANNNDYLKASLFRPALREEQ